MCEDLDMNGTSEESSFEQFLVAISTYMVVQTEAALRLFEEEPEERTPKTYLQLLEEVMEEFSRGIEGEAPGVLPGLKGQHNSFRELLTYNLTREDRTRPAPDANDKEQEERSKRKGRRWGGSIGGRESRN